MNRDQNLSLLILSIFAFSIYAWFSKYASPSYLAEDIPAHAEIARRMIENRQIVFYDRLWFTGWPAFQFYGFLPHLLVAILSAITKIDCTTIIRTICVIACALLPFSFHYAVRSLTENKAYYIALISSVLTLWFLILDEAFYGIGAMSILGVGLFPQIFGWHFVLIGMGLVFKKNKLIALIIPLSILSHTLSAFFLLIFCFFWFILRPESRKYLIISIVLSFGMLAFWLYPFFKFNSEYTSADVYQMPRDWLSLLLRYPLTQLKLISSDLMRLIFVFCFAFICFGWNEVKNNKIYSLIIIILLFSLFATSNYIAASIPLAMHYYRVEGMIVIPVIILIASILVEISEKKAIFKYLSLIALIVACVTTILNNSQPIKLDQVNSDLVSIATYLKQARGRVFVEYNNDYRKVAKYSSHYLESNLVPNEVVNGLFVESTNISRYLAFSADILEGDSFHGYLLFIEGTDVDKNLALEQFKSFGVRSIVASTEKFSKNLETLVGPAKFISGPYKVYEMDAEPLLHEVQKTTVGYLDLSHSLPFNIISQYFYSKAHLYRNFELIELSNVAPVDYLMINGEEKEIIKFLKKTNDPNIKVIPFKMDAKLKLSLARKEFPVDPKVEVFQNVKEFFDNKVNLVNKLVTSPLKQVESLPIEWDGSTLYLEKLKVGKMYKLNYSYSPLFLSRNLKIYRGMTDRTLIIPMQDGTSKIFYSLFNLDYYILSQIFSFISFLAYLWYSKKHYV